MSRRLLALAVVALTVGAFAAACGLPNDDQPRQIAADKVPFELLGPSTTAQATDAGPAGSQVNLYFVHGTQLQAVRRSVDQRDAQTVLSMLGKGKTDTDPIDIRPAIPQGTLILDAGFQGDVLVVTLSNQILSVTGAEQKAAFAQLVFTATDLPAVRSIRFRVVDGSGTQQDVHPLTDNGLKPDDVTRADFLSLQPEG